MEAHVRLPHVIDAAQQLADGLENPCRLVTLHRDIDQLHDDDGNRLGDVPLSGGVSRHRAVSCVDYAALSSGMTTSSTWSLFMVSSSRMECSEK